MQEVNQPDARGRVLVEITGRRLQQEHLVLPKGGLENEVCFLPAIQCEVTPPQEQVEVAITVQLGELGEPDL